MAYEQHVAVVRRGESAIREWRLANPGVRLDLSGASIPYSDMSGANLEGADLSGATLYRTRLARTNLRRSNLRGVSLTEVVLTNADLSHADLRGARADGVDLSRANLSWAALEGASLSADMSHATLQGTSLRDASLIGADLSDANLSGSHLVRTRFQGTRLVRTDLSRVTVQRSVFVDCDLSQCLGLRSARHDAPSYIGTDTLLASLRGSGNVWELRVETFLVRAGVPRELLRSLPDIVAAVEFPTTLVSFARLDRPMAEGFREGLMARGVPCWLDELDGDRQGGAPDATPARLRDVQKVVVLCSAQALARQEVLQAIADRIDLDHDKVLTISLDPVWREPGFSVMLGDRDLKPFLQQRSSADLALTTTYAVEVERLLAALRLKKNIPARQV